MYSDCRNPFEWDLYCIIDLYIIFNASFFFSSLLSLSYLVQVLAELNLQSFELAEPLE